MVHRLLGDPVIIHWSVKGAGDTAVRLYRIDRGEPSELLWVGTPPAGVSWQRVLDPEPYAGRVTYQLRAVTAEGRELVLGSVECLRNEAVRPGLPDVASFGPSPAARLVAGLAGIAPAPGASAPRRLEISPDDAPGRRPPVPPPWASRLA